jgi:hypothetical protein
MQAGRFARKRTTTGTFRIPEDTYQAIQREAENREVSLNTLVNQILHAHLEEEIIGKSLFVRMPKSVYKSFLSAITDEQAREIGELDAERVAKSLMLAKHGTVSTYGILEHLRLFANSAGYGEYSEVEEEGKKIVTIMHEFGRRGSILFAAHARALFQMNGSQPKISTTDGALIIEI